MAKRSNTFKNTFHTLSAPFKTRTFFNRAAQKCPEASRSSIQVFDRNSPAICWQQTFEYLGTCMTIFFAKEDHSAILAMSAV